MPASAAASPTFESTPLLHCPSRDPIPYPVSYPTTWYALRKTPAFRACSNCYRSSILPRGLSPHFYPVVESLAGPERFCNYNTPRVRALVAKYSIPPGSRAPAGERWEKAGPIPELEAHAAHRVTVGDCKLARPVAPDEGSEWHRLRGGMDACHACFADFLSAADFADRVPRGPVRQPATQMALCDLGNAFARRMAVEAGDYAEFIAALARRTAVARCPGPQRVEAGERAWWRPRDRGARGMVICEECFLDAAGGTQYETLFEGPVSPSSLAGLGPRTTTGLVACGFGTTPALAVNFGLMMEFRNPKLFLRAAETVLANAPCDPAGIPPSTPYFALPSVRNFAVCAPCAATLVAPIGVLDAHLEVGDPGTLPAGTVCALNAANPRVEQYIKKISESAEKGEPSIFLSTASYLSTSPPCPRSMLSDSGASGDWDDDGLDGGKGLRRRQQQGHRWTGTGEFSACEDCARDVVLQSPLAVFMTYREARVPGPRKCDFYSPRVRGFWGQASRARDLRGALSDFTAIMRHRDAVYRKMIRVGEDVEGGGVEGVEDVDIEELRGRLRELEALWQEVE